MMTLTLSLSRAVLPASKWIESIGNRASYFIRQTIWKFPGIKASIELCDKFDVRLVSFNIPYIRFIHVGFFSLASLSFYEWIICMACIQVSILIIRQYVLNLTSITHFSLIIQFCDNNSISIKFKWQTDRNISQRFCIEMN